MKIFESVAQLKLASLKEGQLVSTKQYYASPANTGYGAATYKIVTAVDFGGTPDEYGDHTLANGNVALLQTGGVVNVKQYGAIGDDVADDTAAIKAALASWPASTGGSVFLPDGVYLISEALRLDRGHKLIGNGRLSTKIKRIDTVSETIDAVSTTAILYIGDTWISVEDLAIESDDSAVDGVVFSHAGPPSFINFKNVDINNLRTCFEETAGLFMSTFSNVNMSSCVNGVMFDSITDKTSLTFNSCYFSSGAGQAYKFQKAVYSTMNGCGVDGCNSSAQNTEEGVYDFFICNMTLNGCGTEAAAGGAIPSYGNGSIRSQSSTLTVNNFTSIGGRSTFVPDYGTYPNFGIGPIQTGITFNCITINGVTVTDFQNTSGSITGPTSNLVSFNYDGSAFDFGMVTVGPCNIGPDNMFAGHGDETRYCSNSYIKTTPVVVGARATAGQALTASTFTKVTVETEEFDTRGTFTSSTFTPDVEGYYQINGAVSFGGALTEGFASIFKNGAEFKRGSSVSSTLGAASVSSVVYMNGSTDTIELYTYATGSGLVVTAGEAFTYLNASYSN